ncbi:ABC transporter permease [Desulfovibrio caledoniensis]
MPEHRLKTDNPQGCHPTSWHPLKGAIGRILSIYYREIVIMRGRGLRLLSGMAVSPTLYFVIFTQTMDHTRLEGVPYSTFLLPGLAAMASMTQSYALATEINIARFYFHTFDEIQASPIRPVEYVMGEVLAGTSRGLAAGGVVAAIGGLFRVPFHAGPLFWAGIFLNAFCFACIAVAIAMAVRSHRDQALLNNFIITPMAFLGGTFFSVKTVPEWASLLLNMLPLTQASSLIRQASLASPVELSRLAVLTGLGAVFFMAAVLLTKQSRE